jgi:hypothetical protein
VSGDGGCFLCSPEDLLNKNVNYAHINIKSLLFLWKTPEIKKFVEIFLMFKNILLSHPGLLSVLRKDILVHKHV